MSSLGWVDDSFIPFGWDASAEVSGLALAVSNRWSLGWPFFEANEGYEDFRSSASDFCCGLDVFWHLENCNIESLLPVVFISNDGGSARSLFGRNFCKSRLFAVVVTYNSAIAVCQRRGHWNDALQLLNSMCHVQLLPDVAVQTKGVDKNLLFQIGADPMHKSILFWCSW